MRSTWIFPLATVLASTSAWAHQPVLNDDVQYTLADPYVVQEPEISKAIYAELTGRPHYYQIHSDVPFDFYAGVTAPKVDGCELETWFSFEVLASDLNVIAVADGESFEWWSWFEEFGRQWYWVGPEIGENFLSNREYPAGTYYIRVFNADNVGKYVLAIGDVESFTPAVIGRAMRIVPEINERFWGDATCYPGAR
jgi:hypothetical protein